MPIHISEVILDRHHYKMSLIESAILRFPEKPAALSTLPDGSIRISFESQNPHQANDFANHLLAVRRQQSEP